MAKSSIQRVLKRLLEAYPVRKAGLFGSVARGDDRPKSDVDVLVEFSKPISLFEFIGIKQDLEKALKRKVDLVEYHMLKPALRKRVLSEEVSLL